MLVCPVDTFPMVRPSRSGALASPNLSANATEDSSFFASSSEGSSSNARTSRRRRSRQQHPLNIPPIPWVSVSRSQNTGPAASGLEISSNSTTAIVEGVPTFGNAEWTLRSMCAARALLWRQFNFIEPLDAVKTVLASSSACSPLVLSVLASTPDASTTRRATDELGRNGKVIADSLRLIIAENAMGDASFVMVLRRAEYGVRSWHDICAYYSRSIDPVQGARDALETQYPLPPVLATIPASPFFNQRLASEPANEQERVDCLVSSPEYSSSRSSLSSLSLSPLSNESASSFSATPESIDFRNYREHYHGHSPDTRHVSRAASRGLASSTQGDSFQRRDWIST